jgi:hypothetical protein
MGLKEHIVFPEINYDKIDEVWGMDIIICTTAKTDAEAKALLKHFNMPFKADRGRRGHGKKSMVEREKKRQRLVKKYAAKRAALKAIANGREQADGRALQGAPEAGQAAAQFLAHAAAQPLRTDGPSARLLSQAETQSRIMLRDLASFGQIPGMVKSSW